MKILAKAIFTKLAVICFAVSLPIALRAQSTSANSGTVRGSVVDPSGAANDDSAENILQPGGRRLRIGAAQMDMVPGDDRHRWSPLCFLCVVRCDVMHRGMKTAAGGV